MMLFLLKPEIISATNICLWLIIQTDTNNMGIIDASQLYKQLSTKMEISFLVYLANAFKNDRMMPTPEKRPSHFEIDFPPGTHTYLF